MISENNLIIIFNFESVKIQGYLYQISSIECMYYVSNWNEKATDEKCNIII